MCQIYGDPRGNVGQPTVGLQQGASLKTEASNILDKVTTYTKCVSEVGVLDRLSEMDILVEDTLDQKEKYVEAVRKEVADRDLSEEKIKNVQALKIQLPKFKSMSHQCTYTHL